MSDAQIDRLLQLLDDDAKFRLFVTLEKMAATKNAGWKTRYCQQFAAWHKARVTTAPHAGLSAGVPVSVEHP